MGAHACREAPGGCSRRLATCRQLQCLRAAYAHAHTGDNTRRAERENASPVSFFLLMQIPLTAHGLRCHKPAYAASDASQQDWQDGCMRATLDPRGLREPDPPPSSRVWNGRGGNPNKLSSPLPYSRKECDRPACSRSAIRSACTMPRRAGRIDDLVGPAVSRRGTPGGWWWPISDVSDPTSRSPKYISTSLVLQPCGPRSHS